MTFSLPWIAGALVGALFLVSGTVELMTRRKFVAQFVGWGYPEYWPAVTFVSKMIAGSLVFLPMTRAIGLALCGLISLAAIATLVRHYKPESLPPLFINGVLLVLIAISLR